MGKIIYCSDLVLRVDNSEEINNITEWIMASTDFRPAYPDGCVVRNELSAAGKLGVIMIVWMALIILTTFYCYFCERRLFPMNLKDDSAREGSDPLEEETYSSLSSSDDASSLLSPLHSPRKNSRLFPSSSRAKPNNLCKSLYKRF
eukprot:TRINITY_DN25852_c0_g1_i1.p1 TRINITY_DN25852_c0_g1~~TRINITY_DN25852_c0_g1_i1.p1  ORF type:complete len:162 (-),score=40.38 TRINITY_DN25852_c0_g1_i1:111-548(-)